MGDHRRGALIGLAVGDALGAAVEFSSPGTFPPVTGYRSGGPHGLDAGEWTDDTSMALALADSMASVGWDLNDQASRYVEWWKTGKYSVNGRCFDIGITTRSALSNFLVNKNALTSGDVSERASGNGSIMRLAPVPIGHADLYPDNIEELSRLADESSLPTHASEQCRSACRYLATVLAALAHGEDRRAVLSPDWKPLQILNDIKPLHSLIQEVAQGSFRGGWSRAWKLLCGPFMMPILSRRPSCGLSILETMPTPPGQSADSWLELIGANRISPDRCGQVWHEWICWRTLWRASSSHEETCAKSRTGWHQVA
jgi:ADP-ribosylglycohydrolase